MTRQKVSKRVSKKDPEIGKTYGTWLIVNPGSKNSYGHKRWSCRCIGCKREKLSTKQKILGLLRCHVCLGNPDERWSTYPLGRVWYAMIRRCHSPSSTNYLWYGARGISVYQPWRESFPLFADYIEKTLGPRPKGKSLDRKDNSKGYCPGNLKWSTSSEQARNTRQNYLVAYKNQTKCLADWSDETGVPRSLIKTRLIRGWTIAAALTTPVSRRLSNK